MNALFITRYHYSYSNQTTMGGSAHIAKRMFASLRTNTIGVGPHHGAGIIARELKNNGVEHIDFKEMYDPSILSSKERYDFIGISFMDIDQNRAVEISRHFTSQGIPVIMGGQRPTLGTDDILGLTDAAIVRGEFEGLGRAVMDDLRKGRLERVYERDSPLDLEKDYMLPDRSIAPLHSKIFTLELGRGCHNKCDFCSATQTQKDVRMRNLEQIAEELDTAQSRRNRIIMLIDNNLGSYSPEYLADVFVMMKKRDLLWGGEGSLETFSKNPYLFELMKRSCILFFTGVEDFNGTIKGAKDKQFRHKSISELKELVEPFNKHDIPCLYSVIFGTDEQTYPESFDSAADTINNLGVIVLPHIATPHPGTPWYDRVRNEGRILDFDLSHYDHKLNIIHRPANMSVEELRKGFKEIYRKLFLNPASYYKRFLANAGHLSLRSRFFLTPFVVDGIATAAYMSMN